MSSQGRRLLTGGRAFRDRRCQHRCVDEDRALHQRGRQVVVRDRHAPAAATGREADDAVVAVYLTESAKYASSAVTRFRRSDFIEAMNAFAFVLANFGIAMAAKMP